MSSGTKIESNTYLPKGLKCTRIRKMTIFLQEKPRTGSKGAARCFRRSARGWRGIIESRTARDRSFFPRGRFLRDIWTSKNRIWSNLSDSRFAFFLFFFFFSTLDRRHPPRDTISEHPSTSVAARSERRRQRFGVGHGGNVGPQSDSVGESRRRYQTVAFA